MLPSFLSNFAVSPCNIEYPHRFGRDWRRRHRPGSRRPRDDNGIIVGNRHFLRHKRPDAQSLIDPIIKSVSLCSRIAAETGE
jgi:hypothetical protein